MPTQEGPGGEWNFKISGDEVDDKNLKGDLLHLTFSLSEGNIFWSRGRGGCWEGHIWGDL